MKTMKSIKTRIILTATAFITFMNITPVRADGLNIQPLKDWITNYMVPLKDVLLWGVPTVTGVVCLIIGIRYLDKKADGDEQKPYIIQIKPVLIAAAVLMGVDIFLQAFSIVNG